MNAITSFFEWLFNTNKYVARKKIKQINGDAVVLCFRSHSPWSRSLSTNWMLWTDFKEAYGVNLKGKLDVKKINLSILVHSVEKLKAIPVEAWGSHGESGTDSGSLSVYFLERKNNILGERWACLKVLLKDDKSKELSKIIYNLQDALRLKS